MRLIDTDELWKHKFKSASERMDLSVEYMGGWNDAIDSIVEIAPTVDTEPIRHGHWRERYDTRYHYECPFCKYLHQYKDYYCPNCGAKMDEEEQA